MSNGKNCVNALVKAYDRFTYNETGVVRCCKKYGTPTVKAMKGKITFEQYNALVRKVNRRFAALLFERGKIHMPLDMGYLTIHSWQTLRDGKDGDVFMGSRAYPDWNRTLQLWKKDPAARERKQLVHHASVDTARIKYAPGVPLARRDLKFWPDTCFRKQLVHFCRQHTRDGVLHLPVSVE
jgi:hypothetical protein